MCYTQNMADDKTAQTGAEKEINQVVPPSISQKKKPGFWPVIILLFLLLSSLVITGYFVYQNYQLKKQILSQEQSITSPEPEPTVIPEAETNEWETAKFGGLFSYDYPIGWHVGEIWSDSQQYHEIFILMDQKPISTAPRGGPRATFELSVVNGLPNPDEVFEEKKAEFSEDNYTDITTEIINSDIGQIFYYRGKVAGEMFKGEIVERYYLTFRKSETDPLNQQIIIGTIYFQDDPKLSEMLRHIMLSIKQLD